MKARLHIAGFTVQCDLRGPHGRQQLWAYVSRAWRPGEWTQRDGHGTGVRKEWLPGEWEAVEAALKGRIKRPDQV